MTPEPSFPTVVIVETEMYAVSLPIGGIVLVALVLVVVVIAVRRLGRSRTPS